MSEPRKTEEIREMALRSGRVVRATALAALAATANAAAIMGYASPDTKRWKIAIAKCDSAARALRSLNLYSRGGPNVEDELRRAKKD